MSEAHFGDVWSPLLQASTSGGQVEECSEAVHREAVVRPSCGRDMLAKRTPSPPATQPRVAACIISPYLQFQQSNWACTCFTFSLKAQSLEQSYSLHKQETETRQGCSHTSIPLTQEAISFQPGIIKGKARGPSTGRSRSHSKSASSL